MADKNTPDVSTVVVSRGDEVRTIPTVALERFEARGFTKTTAAKAAKDAAQA